MKQHILTALRWLTKRVEGWGSVQTAEPDALALIPLTPRYVPAHHGLYLDLIESALADDKDPVRNIALTGSYGVGKSSILEELARQHQGTSLSISLSSVGPATEEEASTTPKGSTAASTKTNRIQKEIVKQLLYSQDPTSMPGSGYRRVSRFRWWKSLPSSLLFALPVTVAFLLLGWSTTIATVVGLPADQVVWIHPVVFLTAALVVWLFRAALHNRIYVEKLSAGAATISLSPTSATYFDEYLDEIVYFFEVNRCDLLIFEDIDRFDDAHIFETLRSLNAILNKAEQLRGRNIRFVYAIKDSIFERLGDPTDSTSTPPSKSRDLAQDELARSNRTKFFDVVVPVVPFVTHRSARDLFDETLKDIEHKVSSKLIDLAARHLADMRLIKNVRNEFVIFKRKIIDPDDSIDLKQTNLFAMMLYKSSHLADFELVKLGTSKLDELYRIGRDLVNTNTQRLNREIAEHRSALRRIRGVRGRGKQLGVAFQAHLDVMFGLLNASPIQYVVAGTAVSADNLATDGFWEQIVSGQVLELTYRQPGYGQSMVRIGRDEATVIVNDPLDSTKWVESERRRLQNLIDVATEERSFLAHADMVGLAGHDAFTVEFDGEQRTFLEVAQLLLPSELAVQLVRAGYIDRNFTLYTSTFHANRASLAATNFVLKNIEPNIIDMAFPLQPIDVEAILRDMGEEILTQRAAYNVTLVDYLLAKKPSLVEHIVTQLLRRGPDEVAFLNAYLESGTHPAELIRDLTLRATWILEYLIVSGSMDDDRRLKFVDVALTNAKGDLRYLLDEGVRDYLEASYAAMPSLTTTQLSDSRAKTIASIIRQSGAILPTLDGLSRNVVEAVVAADSYVLSRDNILAAVGDAKHDLTLNAIQKSSADVYQKALRELPEYLKALESDESAVDDADALGQILNDAAEIDEDFPPQIVQRTADGCVLGDLEGVTALAWPELASSGHLAPSFANVRAFIDSIGVTNSLASMLTAQGAIQTGTADDEAAKLEVALKLLNAVDVLPSPRLRAELVGSLSLKNNIDVSSIPVEKGQLVGWLIKEEVIEDDPTAFAAIAAGDVDGRIFALSKSGDFASFMDATLVAPGEVGQIVQSSLTPEPVKAAIVDRFTEFTNGSDARNLGPVARQALALGKVLAIDETTRLATQGVLKETVVATMQPHLPALSEPQIVTILTALGGKYAQLSARNGRHPRILNTPNHQAIVDRLIALGIAKSSSVVGSDIKVNMRQG